MTQSETIFRELVKPSEVPRSMQRALACEVQRELTERRIYGYLEVKQSPSAASYILACEVVGNLKGRPQCKFPMVIADVAALTTNQSLPCFLNAGGSPVGDCQVVRLANPFDTSITGIQVVTLQPFRANLDIDELVLNLVGANGTNVIGWRALLGVVSTKYN